MSNSHVLRGVATISFWAEDVTAARTWYSELLGVEPYFQRPDPENPQYVEFRIGDYQVELGIINAGFAPPGLRPGPGGTVIYWAVDDLEGTLAKLMAMGAKEFEPVTPRGPGFTTASVVDPFGNVLGIMHNVHYLELADGPKEP